MSYILDALKKSDQQRQRGATPTLPPALATVAAPKRSSSVLYGALAVVLLCAGIAIGWLNPWQEEQTAPESVAARPAMSNPGLTPPTPRPGQPEVAGESEQKLQVSTVAPVAPTPTTGQDQKAMPLPELPLAIQQELPVMTIQLHSYSSKTGNSLVSINSRMLKEGESLAPGLRLEQITPDGVIFSYKGYRFQRGIR